MSSTGYGPRTRPYFDGCDELFELWEEKFRAYLRLQKLHEVLTADSTSVDSSKNADVYCELVQCLDDKSLSLIIRDAKNDGRKSLEILHDHFLGSSKPRIISLYCELTALHMKECENVTEYILRAEKTSTSLLNAGETISDSLLVAMVLKGLPESFKAFSTVITQRDGDSMTFPKFKSALRSFEESEKIRESSQSDKQETVFKMSGRSIKCYACGKQGHIRSECKNRTEKWCNFCKSRTHDTKYCRRLENNNSTNTVCEDQSLVHDDSYFFHVTVANFNSEKHKEDTNCNLLVDCGATAHIICDRSKFIKVDKSFNSEKHFIELADGTRKNGIVSAKGDAKVTLKDSSGNETQVILKNALCIPSFTQNILSVRSITEAGASLTFTPSYAEMCAPSGKKFTIRKTGKLYYLNALVTNSEITRSLKEWHEVLGHCNVKDVLKLEGVVQGMKISDKSGFNCVVCAKGKMSEYRNRTADERAGRPLELVHSDLAGPVSPVSSENSKYVISFVDDYSGIIFVYFLKNKSDAVEATAKFIADVTKFGSIKRLRSDNGSEYTSKQFVNLMVENKIAHEFSAPYSPHQNGTAERTWRTLFDMARCLLLQAKLPKKLWNYAVRASAYIRNRCYNGRTGKTPFQLFTSKQPNISNMHTFGTTCFAYVQNKHKLDDRAIQGVFVGYDPCSPAYLVYLPLRGVVQRVRCVKFFDKNASTNPNSEEMYVPHSGEISVNDNSERNFNSTENGSHHMNPEKLSHEHETVNEEKKTYPTRDRKRPDYLGYDTTTFLNDQDLPNNALDYCYTIFNVPNSYNDALSSPNSRDWKTAMEIEIKSLHKNKTYDLVPRPRDRSVVKGRWVYALKMDANGNETYKARFVAKGYSQVAERDYHETFSPTARIASVRMLMQIAVQESLIIHQMDVKSAYLNAEIDCEIFVEQPAGFVSTGANGEDLVCKLRKSLYGLKQSGRNWNHVLHNYLLSLNFQQSLCDNCVYFKFIGDEKCIVIVWVDDLIIAASDKNMLEITKLGLSSKFEMKDLGIISWFLGIEFHIRVDVIEMNQTKFIDKLLLRFRVEECTPKCTPCNVTSATIDSDKNSQVLADPKLYREIVGSLIYLMTCTRPDICYIVSKLSQFLSNPTYAHLNLSKHVLKYLKGTRCQSIQFTKTAGHLNLVGFCDADWGGSVDRKSISGYCFKLSDCGTLISWRSQKQNTVALSTCEAEYISLTHAIQEGNFLRQLLCDMQGIRECCINLHVDNRGAIDLANNPVHHQRSKHIDIRYHYIRSQIQSKTVQLFYVPSKDNIADIFTKPATKVNLRKFNVCQ